MSLVQAADLRNKRVLAKLRGDTEAGHWIFRSLTPKGMIVMAGYYGMERFFRPDEIESLNPDPIKCPKCRIEHQIWRESLRCVDCEREAGFRSSKPSETCETCGELGAFYSPRAKRFGCAQCHAKAGTLTGIGPEARVMMQAAPCRSDDIHSERHEWKKLKTSYVCAICKVRTHDKPGSYVA